MPVARRSTSGRSRGSIQARPRPRAAALSGGGSAGTRLTSTLAPAIVTVSLLGAFVAVTGPGRAIATGVLRFLLFYGGVFALIAMTAAVGIGLVATDRIIMKPGHRVTAQAVHRAVSLAALAFLAIHIWLEIAAARSQLADAVIPFLARGRTFYIGLGTVASDLILIIVASGFLRAWFAGFSRPWVWRAVHASAYFSWLLSILHGLLGGRTAKPYVDWSYGACVAAVALALTVRTVAAHRSREEVALAAGPAAGRPAMPPAALTQAGLPQVALGLPAVRALPAGPAGSLPPGPWQGPPRRPAALDTPGSGGSSWPGLRPAAAPAPDSQPPGASPWPSSRPAVPAWDSQRPAAVGWDGPGPEAAPWDSAPWDSGQAHRTQWDDRPPVPLSRESPVPQPSPWDRLRMEEPPAPAGPQAGPLPRRTPGARHSYGRPAR